MKISVKNIFFALGATAMLASCSENSWNDHLDGFEAGVNYGTAQEAEFTMSKADFKSLAANATNIKLAGADTLALKAVGKNGYFTPVIPAVDYLPAFLASTDSPYFLFPDGSKVNITYKECAETDPIISQIAGALTYSVNSIDYQNAWKSDVDFIDAFAPMTPATSSLPGILKLGLPDAQEGQYAVVNYSEATDNPIFIQLGGGETEEPLQVIYSEPFNENEGKFLIYDEIIPEELKYVWKWGGANYGMKATAYLNDTKTNFASESWIISPEITLGGEKANFAFDQALNFFSDIETAKEEATVWVRISGGDWSRITGYDFPESMSWTFVNSGEIDLSEYCGKTIQIGFCYKSTDAKAGTWEVKNFVVNAQEGSVGANPGFFGMPMKKVLANTPVTVEKTAIYRFDGSSWKEAEGVLAVQPADYKAMGFSVGSLADPSVMLPLFLKNNVPYAVSGNKMSVVYNGTACSVLVFDGQKWNVNINEMVTQIAQFIKEDGNWRFEKYMNTDSYVLCTEIVLDTQYLLVASDVCACPLKASYNYGYLPKEAVEIVDDIIEQRNDANAFTFASSASIDGVDYELGEGEFLIKDSNGRYLLMQGTYNSFNVTNTPAVADGKISDAYVFTAEPTDNGTWTITNKGMEKWIQYSIKYGSWGCYATEQAEAELPSLYILTEE